MNKRRTALVYAALCACLIGCFALALAAGSVDLPAGDVFEALRGSGRSASRAIVVDLRLTRALTAALGGASLAASGLLLQTLFRNPLAEPYLLGVTSGSALGVATVVFGTGILPGAFATGFGTIGSLGMFGASALGGAFVLALMLGISSRIGSSVAVLLLGVMIGALARGIVYLFIAFASPEEVQAFALWETGSFRSVGWPQIPVYVSACAIGLAVCMTVTKGLNAFLLGEDYARSMGVGVPRLRLICLISAAMLAGAVTTFCGPIAFLGLSVPHIARSIIGDSDHRVLMPAAMLLGAAMALLCSLVCEMPGTGSGVTLPINAATSLVGAPVVIWVLLRLRRVKGLDG